MDKRSRIAAIGLSAFACFSALIGLGKLAAFDSAPGPHASTPLTWPASSSITRAAGRPTLLFFAHPFCSCTRASVSELENVGALQSVNAASITFMVYRPDKSSSWNYESLSDLARYLPPHKFIWDDGAREARRFGVKTSGSVLLYSPSGVLLFEGGVTGARGHAGGNYGIDRLAGMLLKQARPGEKEGAPVTAPTFGCALGSWEPEERANL